MKSRQRTRRRRIKRTRRFRGGALRDDEKSNYMAFGEWLIGQIIDQSDQDKLRRSREIIGIGLSKDKQNAIYEGFLNEKDKIKEEIKHLNNIAGGLVKFSLDGTDYMMSEGDNSVYDVVDNKFIGTFDETTKKIN